MKVVECTVERLVSGGWEGLLGGGASYGRRDSHWDAVDLWVPL